MGPHPMGPHPHIDQVLLEVTQGEREGGSDKKGGKRTDFDSEMVQEQQQEEEKQKEQEQEQQDQVIANE